ncbi:hypothetical protein TWF481_005498 [Arthrobotrys musiformis]|uniref:RxLR effector protein n=1 Tax=Arthrobotrys musiformis TaxID=47236 RepID=A0AAV9WEV1_9PEZI
MQLSYIFGLLVAVSSVAALPTTTSAAAESSSPSPVPKAALLGTTDSRGNLLRIFRLAAVKKDKNQLANDRLAVAPAVKADDTAAKEDEAKADH